MKNNKSKKIAQYSAIALAAATVLPMACKKEATEADDPNIVHRDLNKTIFIASSTNVVDTIDIDLDGIFDVGFAIYSSATSIVSIVAGLHNSTGIYCDTATAGGSTRGISKDSNNQNSLLTIFECGTWMYKIRITSNELDNQNLIDLEEKIVTKIEPSRLTGLKLFNGWLKLNLSTDRKTLVLKDLAYSVLPATPIKTGAK